MCKSEREKKGNSCPSQWPPISCEVRGKKTKVVTSIHNKTHRQSEYSTRIADIHFFPISLLPFRLPPAYLSLLLHRLNRTEGRRTGGGMSAQRTYNITSSPKFSQVPPGGSQTDIIYASMFELHPPPPMDTAINKFYMT